MIILSNLFCNKQDNFTVILEAKVELLGDKGKGTAQEKRKVAATDEIRVRHFLP